MAGIPGSGGPPPKRTDQRRRRNLPGTPDGPKRAAVKAPTPGNVSRPPADPAWHHAATAWYESFERSGQSAFFTDTDWTTAWVAAETISREFNEPGRVSGAAMAQFFKACTILLACEGDRRRVQLELTRDGASGARSDDGGTDNGEVSWLDARRRRSG